MTVQTSPSAGGNAVSKGGDASPPATVDQVSLTIDGVEVSVPKNTLVIRAAEEVGVQIPRFCDHPLLEPVGACRQCLVDIATPGPDGSMRAMPKPQASCTITVSEGMQVKTQQTSPVADKAQQGVMELLLINHPLDCPVCDKGGECPLQNQAMSNGRAVSRFEDVKRTYPKPINISSQVLLDRERCVLCARCTRFSDQIAGDPFIALVERGALQQVGIYEQQPFESYFSGNTVQICPVGALTGAAYRFRSRPFDLMSTPSVCEHCASGCSIRTDHRRGVVLRRMAINDPAVNEEWNCDKGRWAFQYATTGDRIQYPMVRDEFGDLQVASWPEALEAAANGLRAAKGVGVLVGGRVSAEDAYAYSKFARTVVDTNDVDFRARPHSQEEADFLASTVVATGPHGAAVTYAELETARTVVLVGFEPEEESPIVFLRLRKAHRKNKTAVYAVAPFATRGLEKLGGTLIPAAPGTEAEVLRALGDGVTGDGAAAKAAQALEEPGTVVLVGERLATVPGALSAAAALTSSVGARLAWVPRRAGERGALEAGALPTLLPGGRPVADPAARQQVAEAWDVVGLPDTPGRDTAGIIAAATTGDVNALVVGGVDARDLADPRAEEALAKTFVVSLEVRPSSVTEVADVVFPVAAHAEKGGTFVDWEGRTRPFATAIDTAHNSDYRVLDMLAGELGSFLGARTLTEVRADMSALGPWEGQRPAAPSVAAGDVPHLPEGKVVLATWHHLLDRGSLQDGEPFLAGTAHATRARVSAATAEALGLVDGDTVRVAGDRGAISAPVEVTPDMVDHVVWLPTNSEGSRVRATLGADAGALVSLTKAANTVDRKVTQ
ncbi:NADH-quinone oxidoreductase subunit G [Phycicoccus sp. Root563]|uniref:NADH-quinone oxidoreductase subunit G n=1 Tax=Phycicoccus sp. Root563 TaxID=1736562 RepID=UPI0007030C17|nr:NADH-quinone oxidoreductase subunit G [Phycicoccus sp. Root563]KQZ89317.1 NADH-quinone oxidoreductase subunit G [Phycicoccus sp. Root563]